MSCLMMCNIGNPINCLSNTHFSMSFECKKLVHVHFLKQVLLPCNACEVSLYIHDVALVHSAVLRKRNFANLGEWLPGVGYLEAKMHGGAPFGGKILSAVRNREASASRRLLMYYSYGIFNP